MNVAHSIRDCRQVRHAWGELAFVPTMGALHEGHLSLIRIARRHAARVAVSIFVNPTQFGPAEDFTRYPRPIEDDLALCRSQGVDLVFNPAPEEMYPPGTPAARIDVAGLPEVLEGAHRPGHFTGVCQVVAKLFNIVQPTVACFGQKDFQQLRIIEEMTRALDFPVRIVRCPTLREPDGLAMSSRNRYLSPDDRPRALSISRGLRQAGALYEAGERRCPELEAAALRPIREAGLEVDYVAAVDESTMRPYPLADRPTVLAVAARVGRTRLIDNLLLGDSTPPG